MEDRCPARRARRGHDGYNTAIMISAWWSFRDDQVAAARL